MKLNKTHLILSTTDLGGFRGFEVERDKIPALSGLTEKDLQCKNTLALVALQVCRHIHINGFSDANKRGMSCLLSMLPQIEEGSLRRDFTCGLSYIIEPGYASVAWRVVSDCEQLAEGRSVTVEEAIKTAESEIEDIAGK